ncbi:hypothetical protein [Motilimonas pumila]|uniref:Uncharacterized protein n=1 Tax=Motilimonas pumila TaxID=2303987 RepID=A0A418YH82_9GAMM|nr:hypothetical protein [Motilimonas pumila]RJG49455.1 hypothetical protein D1Z90_05725 [Motilimonas pumila]
MKLKHLLTIFIFAYAFTTFKIVNAATQTSVLPYVELIRIISTDPFEADIRVSAKEPSTSELMFAITMIGSDKVIWLDHVSAENGIVRVSKNSFVFNQEQHQLQAYRVIKPILVAALTPSPQPLALKKLSPELITPSPLSEKAPPAANVGKVCSIERASSETFWQVAKRYSKEHEIGIYDGLLALYASNVDKFQGKNINFLNSRTLNCASEARIQWIAQQNSSYRWYQALDRGERYDTVIPVHLLPD